MAAKRTSKRQAAGRNTAAAATGTPREKIIDAFMALLAERPFARIGLADVAETAGVSLATLREAYDGKIAMIADWSRRIDMAVLEGETAEPVEAGARDRLFEVMMRRFDALQPHKEALRGLARSARRNLRLACALQAIVSRSQMWMLAAARIHKGGPFGRIAIKGAKFVYLETMRVWFDDDDPGLARTMAALDRSLRRGERAMQWLDDICGFLPRFAARRRRREGRDPDNVAATS
jgi:AcrR family transcriptional regulator